MAKPLTPEAEYRASVERVRQAFLVDRELSGAERQVGLLMLERVNRASSLRGDQLSCWPGIGWLARMSGLGWRGVTKARQGLRDRGAIVEIEERCLDQKDASSARYGFGKEWMEGVEADLANRPEVSPDRGNSRSLITAPPRGNSRSLTEGTDDARVREQTVPNGGNSGSPKPLDRLSRVNPSTKPLEGDGKGFQDDVAERLRQGNRDYARLIDRLEKVYPETPRTEIQRLARFATGGEKALILNDHTHMSDVIRTFSTWMSRDRQQKHGPPGL